MHPMTNIAIRAARDGGRILMRYFDRVDAIKIAKTNVKTIPHFIIVTSR